MIDRMIIQQLIAAATSWASTAAGYINKLIWADSLICNQNGDRQRRLRT